MVATYRLPAYGYSYCNCSRLCLRSYNRSALVSPQFWPFLTIALFCRSSRLCLTWCQFKGRSCAITRPRLPSIPQINWLPSRRMNPWLCSARRLQTFWKTHKSMQSRLVWRHSRSTVDYILSISLRFEQRECLLEGVEWAFINLCPRKPTGCKPHVSGLNCRGFAWRSAAERSFHTLTQIFMLFEAKWNRQYSVCRECANDFIFIDCRGCVEYT